MKQVIVLTLIVYAIFLIVTYFVPVNHKYTKMDCIEAGLCKEGLTLNTEDGQIIINKDSCIKYNGKWEESISVCKFY